jgi:hypothetical protein
MYVTLHFIPRCVYVISVPAAVQSPNFEVAVHTWPINDDR